MNDLTAPPSPALTLSQAVRIAEIHPSPTNPRKTFPEAEQGELIESVKRHGVMQPILVRPWPAAYACEGEQPRYELIAGERRFRAAKAAGLEFIPATVRDLDDHETLELQIVENLHRKDLNELEEAEGYELMTKQYGYTAEQLAEKIGKSKAYIYARLKLTAAGAAARAAFRDGKLDASRLLLVARIPTATLQQQAVEMLTSREHLATYRAAAQYVQTNYMLKLAEAPFPRGDADLLPAAGKCHPCPKRTGSQPALYPDVKSADICTDPECFAAKKAAHFARLKSEAKAQGRPVIEGAAAKKLMPYESADIKGYVKLDGKCYDAYDKETERYPTYRELLAERALPITLVETPDGNVIEAVEQKAFQAIAAEVGVRKPASTGNEDQKKREAEAKEETLVRQRIHAQIRAATQEDIAERGPALEPEELRLVARQYFAATWHENQKRLARLWIESEEKIADSERIGILTTLIDNMTPDQACLFLMDLALIGMTHCGPWDKTETPAPLLATANRLNISVDTIRRQVKADGKAKGQKNKAPAATEAPPPATAETPAPTTTGLKTGDRVRVKPDATRDGFRVGNAGQEGTVHHTDPDEDDIYVAIDGDDRLSIYRFDELELIPLAIQVDEPAVVRSKRTAEMVAYIHPDHADLCWSGRGKKPKWVEHWLAEGGALEELKPPPARCDKTLELPHLDAAPSPNQQPEIARAA